MYPPLATDKELSGIGADIWLLGLSFIEVASIAAAVELIVGIMKCRAPGMRINLMPLFAWYLLIVAGMILFAFPPLIAGDLLFEMQRMFDWPFFDPARGGDPLLWQHLFWIFGHPEVYIIFLPAIALMAMIVPTFAQRPIVGYSWIVLAAVGTGFLSFGLWVHHMFATGLPQISLAFFSAASEAVAIPTGVQIFVFIATMLAGRVIFSTPMLFGTGGLAIFVIGGLTGVMVALAPFDWQAHDTYFIVAHLHYVLIGGMLFPVFAGIYYYYPLIDGRKLSDRLGRLAFWLMFVGFNIAFFPMHLTGLRGMPRRVFTYPDEHRLGLAEPDLDDGRLHLRGTACSSSSSTSLRPKHRQPRGERNPWNAGTLEWINEPEENWGVRSIPHVASRYPLWDQPDLVAARSTTGAGICPTPRRAAARRWSPRCSTPSPSRCCASAARRYRHDRRRRLARRGLRRADLPLVDRRRPSRASAVSSAPSSAGCGPAPARFPKRRRRTSASASSLPLYASGPASVGWWAMFITMIGDGTAFASLVFGYFFFWTIHEDFTAGARRARRVLADDRAGAVRRRLGGDARRARAQRRGGMVGGTRLLLVSPALLAVARRAPRLLPGPWPTGMDPTAHVYPAIVWMLVIWTARPRRASASSCSSTAWPRSLAGRLTPRARHGHCTMSRSTGTSCWSPRWSTFAVVGLFPEAL